MISCGPLLDIPDRLDQVIELAAAALKHQKQADEEQLGLPRRPFGVSRTNTNTAEIGLLRTHSPTPKDVGVAVALLNRLLQLTQRRFGRRKSRPRKRPTQRQPRPSTSR